jgi:hypothetical protein
MGKAKRDGSTPERPTAIERLALTPEQRAAFQSMMSEKLEQAARLDKAAKAIDRTLAINNRLIPPASTKSINRKEGWQARRVKPILLKLWPPNGQPPANLPQKEIVAQVNAAYEPLYGRKVSRNTIMGVKELLREKRLSRR